MNKSFFRISFIGIIFLFANVPLFAQPPILAGVAKIELTPMDESPAFRQFSHRPVTDLSKLLYLIDRFAAADIQVVYDNYQYAAKFAGGVARWFLSQRYHNEPPEYWILNWCNVSFPGGNLIWVKLPNGQYRLAREVLQGELNNLNKAVAEGLKPKPAAPAAVSTAAASPASSAQPVPAAPAASISPVKVDPSELPSPPKPVPAK